MSQHVTKDEEGRDWLFGYDNPCGGFFATRFLSDEEAEKRGEECDVLIGFGFGVSLETLVEQCAAEGLVLEEATIQMLERDEAQEKRPLTPLQQKMRKLAQEFSFE